MFYWFTQVITGLLARILFQLKVTGSENIPSKGAFILASNHRSNLDPFIIAAATERKLSFMAKKELFQTEFSAKVMKMLNAIELNREGMDRSALKKGLVLLRTGRGLLLFPEGKRSVDGRLGPGKAGVALFAFGANVPVIPTFIRGTGEAMPPHSHSIKLAKIRVSFGKRLTLPEATERTNRKSDYQEFTNRIMRGIAELEKEAA